MSFDLFTLRLINRYGRKKFRKIYKNKEKSKKITGRIFESKNTYKSQKINTLDKKYKKIQWKIRCIFVYTPILPDKRPVSLSILSDTVLFPPTPANYL
jgi:hypothetical protein